MLHVKTPEEVLAIIEEQFAPLGKRELIPLTAAIGRTAAEDICAGEFVPDFDRSTVDGYALRAADTFGCTDAIPAILMQTGEVFMGRAVPFSLGAGDCAAIPTGGAVPRGADSVVMIEYTEDYGDGSIGVLKSVAPGQNMIFRGDDARPGKVIVSRGHVLSSQDIGALAAIGCTSVPVSERPVVGIISTGDELVEPGTVPGPGQVRDVNSPMLEAMLTAYGAKVQNYGIIMDDEALLRKTVESAVKDCDAVILSGGSSVGVKDAACRIIESMGELLLHGIAIKPGKPTILGRCGTKPLIGLPGHPVAAWFITKLFVLPLLSRLTGRIQRNRTTAARLTESVSANHGRAQYLCCSLEERSDGLWAHPLRGKSGLIAALSGSDGYFCIHRDCEGLPQGAEIQVTITSGD